MKIITRDSNKQWIKSICSTENKTTRLILIKNKIK